MSPACVFCEIVARKRPADVVYEDGLTVAFMDVRQFHAGHALVIPRQHVPDVRALDFATGAALMATVSRVTQAVGAAFENEGLSVWHSIGVAGFQEVPHLHFHVHPRLIGDQLLRVYPGEPPSANDAERAEFAARLRDTIQAEASLARSARDSAEA